MKAQFLSFLSCALLVTSAWAQTQAPAPAAPPAADPKLASTELEKLAEPIALHPDPLIAIVLPAAAYPVEIVQAARFVKDTNNIPRIDQMPWDDNVKAVAKFPEMIAKMDADLSWTVELGKAFVDQPKELMDAIQALRARAQKAGTLQTTTQQVVVVTNLVVVQTNVSQVVTVTNQIVQVQPSNPEVIYVPSYPPTVYYPPPAYVYDPLAPLVTFGVGMAMGAIIANNCDWHGGCVWVGGSGHHGDVDIDINNVNIDRNNQSVSRSGNRNSATGAQASQQKWQPDQNRMRSGGAPASAQTSEARGWGSSTTRATQPGAQPAGSYAQKDWSQTPGASRQPATPSRGTTPSARPANTGAQGGASRPAPSPAAASRPAASPSPSVSRPSPQPSSAFSGVSSGGGARSASTRGATSRSSGGGGARGGGGRGR